MTKGNYVLGDWGYFKLLQLVAEGLENRDIDYALVGGGAVQARIIDAFNRYEGITAPNVSELFLRRTKDFDITSRSSEGELVYFLNMLQVENEPLSIRPKQPRRVNLAYKGRQNIEPTVVVLNYQLGTQDFSGLSEKFYNECLDTAEDLDLRYNNEVARVRVATPECIVASKLTRSSVKDIFDVSTLLKIMAQYKEKGMKPFNYDLVRRYLEESGKGHCYNNLDSIVTEVLKE
ncbi:MAG: hypothetical protein AABX05_03265 [Nanoarchaeota archaeon]